jgi:hypothetical protein
MMTAKGTALYTIPHFIKNKFGEDALKKWLDSLSPGAKELFAGNIVPVSVYPLTEMFTDPTVKMCEMFYGGDFKKTSDLGRFSADYSLTGVYKFFVKLGSPQYIAKKASVILPTYYQPSTMETVETGDNHAIVRITQFPEIHEVIEYRILGWVQRAIEITGMQGVEAEITKSLSRHDSFTEYVAKWK